MSRISFSTKIVCFIVLLGVLVTQVSSSCSTSYDCKYGPIDSVYNYQCKDDCIGQSCEFHSDCGDTNNEYCCDSTCQIGPCSLAGWIVAIVLAVAIAGIAIIVGIALCCFCMYRRETPGIVWIQHPAMMNPPANHGTFVSTQAKTVQSHPPAIAEPVPPPYNAPPPEYQAK